MAVTRGITAVGTGGGIITGGINPLKPKNMGGDQGAGILGESSAAV